jgi:hypothetical protein
MNPYYYLFYKLSHFLNKKGDNEWGPIFALSVLIGWNFGFIFIKIFPITEINFEGIYKGVLIALFAILFITNAILFLNKTRLKRILNHYKGESENIRKVGNVLVILYVALSLGLIVFL